MTGEEDAALAPVADDAPLPQDGGGGAEGAPVERLRLLLQLEQLRVERLRLQVEGQRLDQARDRRDQFRDLLLHLLSKLDGPM